MKKVYFNVEEKLIDFFNNEQINLSNTFWGNFLKLISKFINYEEEEIKIKPQIIISKNIHSIIKTLSVRYILPISESNLDGEYIMRNMKSILPFCNLGWYVYIDIREHDIEYGLVRSYSGPKGLSLTETVFLTDYNESDSLVFGYVTNNYEIVFEGLRNNKFLLDFKLYNDKSYEDNENKLSMLSEDIVCDHETNKEELKLVFNKLLKVAFQKIHGTILLVVSSGYTPNKFLKDGIWFNTPVDISDSALKCSGKVKDIYLAEKHYSLTGLFIEMLNVDGITIIDSQGRIIAYNVFLKQSFIDDNDLSGGARKRTALSLLKIKDENILGIYFQSQDGENFYERKFNSNE